MLFQFPATSRNTTRNALVLLQIPAYSMYHKSDTNDMFIYHKLDVFNHHKFDVAIYHKSDAYRQNEIQLSQLFGTFMGGANQD